jgi:hypothetical protein
LFQSSFANKAYNGARQAVLTAGKEMLRIVNFDGGLIHACGSGAFSGDLGMKAAG